MKSISIRREVKKTKYINTVSKVDFGVTYFWQSMKILDKKI